MLTFTFAGDESGDVSFSFSKGASRYFVIAVIATRKPDALRNTLVEIREKAHLPVNFDLHFNSLASAKLRDLIFSSLRVTEFDAWALIADKINLPEPFKVMPGLDVYLYFVSELIRFIPIEKRSGGTLILDEFGNPLQTRTELRRVMKARSIAHGFHRISLRRSQSEPLIQIADLVAGAIMRRDAHKHNEAYEKISSKMQGLVEYPY